MRTVRIEFMDGTGEVVQWVRRTEIREGCLCLYVGHNTSLARGEDPTYPLVNIKSWRSE